MLSRHEVDLNTGYRWRPKQTEVHGPVSVLHGREIQRQSESGSDCDTPPASAWLVTVRANWSV